MHTIKVISDLHIGNKDKADDFKLDEAMFIRYIKDVKCDLLVFNGDIVECLESGKWDREEGRFWDIYKVRPVIEHIVQKIERDEAEWVVGNHDRIVFVKQLVNCKKRLIIDKEGVRVVVEHGHQPDMFNYKFAFIGNFLTWICGSLERVGWKNVEYNFSKLLKKMPIAHREEARIYKQYTEKLHKKLKADIVVLGHTHKVQIFDYGKFIYANSGKACSDKYRFDEITITIDNGSYNVEANAKC